MSVTELDEVQALLDKVLPDPAGFAQRLVLQVLGRWGGQSAAAAAAPFTTPFRTPSSFTTATAEDVTETVATAAGWPSYEAPVDMNILLSAALGACECWGLRPGCELCGGRGCAGWTQPDRELYDEFVRPAIDAMSRFSAGDPADSGSQSTTQGDDR